MTDQLPSDDLARRLARLEDERAIIETLHRFGQTFDLGQAEAWAELFTEDGVFLCVDRDGNQILREQGREALAAWAHMLRAAEARRMRHLVIAPVVTLAGDSARVVSSFANMVEHEDPYQPPHVRSLGQYVDDMVRGGDGKWRFRQRLSESQAPLIA